MSDAIDARRKLSDLASELGERADQLADVERRLEPAEDAYEQFVTDFEVGLWTKHENSNGAVKLPSAAMRLKLAHKAMDPELLGRRAGLLQSRDRLRKRISTLKTEVEAQRSILSAVKVEMEATQ